MAERWGVDLGQAAICSQPQDNPAHTTASTASTGRSRPSDHRRSRPKPRRPEPPKVENSNATKPTCSTESVLRGPKFAASLEAFGLPHRGGVSLIGALQWAFFVQLAPWPKPSDGDMASEIKARGRWGVEQLISERARLGCTVSGRAGANGLHNDAQLIVQVVEALPQHMLAELARWLVDDGAMPAWQATPPGVRHGRGGNQRAYTRRWMVVRHLSEAIQGQKSSMTRYEVAPIDLPGEPWRTLDQIDRDHTAPTRARKPRSSG
jgi:hypothetical protein